MRRAKKCVQGAVNPQRAPPGDSQATFLQELPSRGGLLSWQHQLPVQQLINLSFASSVVESTRPQTNLPTRELSVFACAESNLGPCTDLAQTRASYVPGSRDTGSVTHLVALQQGQLGTPP